MDKELKLKILDLMIRARCMEERMINLSKTKDAFFWLGGVGEEAFNVPLGLLADPGPDLDHDYFHFHYRNGSTMMALHAKLNAAEYFESEELKDEFPRDELRQMLCRATDPFSGGRNFCNHYARKDWNVAPVASTIQTQCSIAPGTARAQKRHGGTGITILTFGDAGTAEGDFHVSLNWATLPGWELPLLFICTNNEYGISTPYSEIHGQGHITDIAKGYGIKTALVDGNDVEASYKALEKAMGYVRKRRKPYFLEAKVSRLNGHSSSSGANRVPVGNGPGSECDPLEIWREKLIEQGLITLEDFDREYKGEEHRMLALVNEVKQEPLPEGSSIFDHIFV